MIMKGCYFSQTTNTILSVNSLAGGTNRATLAAALWGVRELLIITNINKFSQHLPQGRAGGEKGGGGTAGGGRGRGG